MYKLVHGEIKLPIEWLITNVTDKWMLAAMYALVSVKGELPTQ
jgi:hypothetical protein